LKKIKAPSNGKRTTKLDEKGQSKSGGRVKLKKKRARKEKMAALGQQ